MRTTAWLAPRVTVRSILVAGVLLLIVSLIGVAFVAEADCGWVAVVFSAPVVWVIVSRKRRRLVTGCTNESFARWLLGAPVKGEEASGQSLRSRLSHIFLCDSVESVMDGDPLSSDEERVFEELTRSYYR